MPRRKKYNINRKKQKSINFFTISLQLVSTVIDLPSFLSRFNFPKDINWGRLSV